mmetsp:Transcript_6378/g.13056  ORF Transcript_6378/g.13056 Transcript_6378/m.13056 type:complete len:257 (+) Transcript_6378:996-1766(+)
MMLLLLPLLHLLHGHHVVVVLLLRVVAAAAVVVVIDRMFRRIIRGSRGNRGGRVPQLLRGRRRKTALLLMMLTYKEGALQIVGHRHQSLAVTPHHVTVPQGQFQQLRSGNTAPQEVAHAGKVTHEEAGDRVAAVRHELVQHVIVVQEIFQGKVKFDLFAETKQEPVGRLVVRRLVLQGWWWLLLLRLATAAHACARRMKQSRDIGWLLLRRWRWVLWNTGWRSSCSRHDLVRYFHRAIDDSLRRLLLLLLMFHDCC